MAFAHQKEDARQFFLQGLELEAECDYRAASEKFAAAATANNAYAEAWFHLAICESKNKNFGLALTHVQKAKKYFGGRADVSNLEGRVLLLLGKYSEAEKIFFQILKDFPNDLDSRLGLAEINLRLGKITEAKNIYETALKKNPRNAKVLLCLAAIYAEEENEKEALARASQALSFGAQNAQSFYVASLLEFKFGKMDLAEKHCLSALQMDAGFSKAYSLLSAIYFSQKRFKEVFDLAEFQISHKKENETAWYLKGLSQKKMGNSSGALETWHLGLEAANEDEIMRAAFECLAFETLPIEDERRAQWAKYHMQKAANYSKKHDARFLRSECQSALRLDPLNYGARTWLSNLLRGEGFGENYLLQLKFIQENEILQRQINFLKSNGSAIDEYDEKVFLTQLSDTTEGFSSLLENTLASKWGVNPFFLDKTRWRVGIYYDEDEPQIFHPELSYIAAKNLRLLFRGLLSQSVDIFVQKAKNYSQAFSDAQKQKADYFLILNSRENEENFKIEGEMHCARTGALVKKISVFKSGNDCYAASLLTFREKILEALPVRARLVARSGNDVLLDIGRTEGVSLGAKFALVKRGALKTADEGTGLYYLDDDFLGEVELTNVSEEVSEGILRIAGFYDRVSVQDELVLLEAKNPQKSSIANDTSPSADKDGKAVLFMPSKKDFFQGSSAFNFELFDIINE